MNTALRIRRQFTLGTIRHSKIPFLVLQADTVFREAVLMDQQQSLEVGDWSLAFRANKGSVALGTVQAKELSDRFPELGQCHALGCLHGNHPAWKYLGSAFGNARTMPLGSNHRGKPDHLAR